MGVAPVVYGAQTLFDVQILNRGILFLEITQKKNLLDINCQKTV